MLALPIFAVSHPTTIFGGSELNFCVRDGNRWTLTPINTNLFNYYSDASSVCQLLFLVTRTGFEPMLTA